MAIRHLEKYSLSEKWYFKKPASNADLRVSNAPLFIEKEKAKLEVESPHYLCSMAKLEGEMSKIKQKQQSLAADYHRLRATFSDLQSQLQAHLK